MHPSHAQRNLLHTNILHLTPPTRVALLHDTPPKLSESVIFYFFIFLNQVYQPVGLAYDGCYTSNTGTHLRPHSPTAYCNSDGPLKVAPHCPSTVPAPFISLPCAPGLYGVSPLDGPVRVGAVSLSAHLPKGRVHNPGVKELG